MSAEDEETRRTLTNSRELPAAHIELKALFKHYRVPKRYLLGSGQIHVLRARSIEREPAIAIGIIAKPIEILWEDGQHRSPRVLELCSLDVTVSCVRAFLILVGWNVASEIGNASLAVWSVVHDENLFKEGRQHRSMLYSNRSRCSDPAAQRATPMVWHWINS
jgi:hypothetical protein